MALNKRKVLDAAQKYLQKGNLDRALKEYSKVLEADPRDTNVRMKVGDVQLRRGKSEEAIEAYFEVAKQFMKNGFDAKAVALFKQITKIDEKRYDIYEPLAELYQRLGLVSEAMTALQTAAESHQREGRKKEGLSLLRKMAALDPSNTATRLKIAEMLWKEDLQDEALAEYDEVVAELGRQQEYDGVVRVHEQVLRLLPERLENLIGLGVAQLEMERPEAAEPPLLKATEVNVEAVAAWEALARVHESLGRRKELEDTWKTVAAIYKDRGDDERAKEILQLYVTPEAFGADDADDDDPELSASPALDPAAPEAPVEDIGGGDTISALAGETGNDLDLEIGEDDASAPDLSVEAASADADDAPELDLDDEIDIELDEEVDVEVAEADEASAPEAAASESSEEEADAAQLLAEAGVYQRYSQHEKAIGCLERILEKDPNHLDALGKLGETRNAMGEGEAAVALWQQAAQHALASNETSAFEEFCERIRAVDEEAAEALAAEALSPNLDAAPAREPDLDLELAFDTPSGEPELTGTSTSPGLDVEVEDLLKEDPSELDAAADAPALDSEPAALDEERTAPDGPEALEADPASFDAAAGDEPDAAAGSLDDEPLPEIEDLSDDAAASAASDGEAPAPTEAKRGGVTLGGSSNGETLRAEDLEEAEFYYRQGLLDEAEQILNRLLTLAPGHPQVLLRLGEIAKSRGECPSSPVADGVDFDRTEDETQPAIENETAGAEASEVGGESLSDATLEDLDAVPDLEEPCAGPDDVTLQADAVDLGGELSDVGDDLDGDSEAGESLGVEVPPPAPVAAAASGDDLAAGEGFDLAAELSDVFDGPENGVSGDLTVGGTTQAGFESIFQSFKQGVKEQLGEGEEETHYDLGIAYREMGLLEDAIGEFRVAMTSPTRKLDCLAMMGLCALDLGRADDAVNHLEQALALPDLDEARMAGLRFDLGRAFEQKGNPDRTRELWEQVKAFDADFQDVTTRLATLGQGDSSPSLGALDPDGIDEPGEAFESFDDLIAEAEADFDSGADEGDDDDDPDGGDDDDPNGASQWGRKVSYG